MFAGGQDTMAQMITVLSESRHSGADKMTNSDALDNAWQSALVGEDVSIEQRRNSMNA